MFANVFSRGRTVLLVIAATGAMFLMVLSACSQPGSPPTSGSNGQPKATTGLHIRLSADKFQFTSADQFCQALLTAEIVVGSHGTARWNTANGVLPATIKTATAAVQGNYRIYTPVTFARLVPLVDHRRVVTKEFLTLGGQVGQDSYFIDDVSTLPGTSGHYLVVLYPSMPQTGGNTEVSLVVGNAYPVDAQGMVVLQVAGNPNEPGVGPTQPAIAIALTSLEQQLAACKP